MEQCIHFKILGFPLNLWFLVVESVRNRNIGALAVCIGNMIGMEIGGPSFEVGLKMSSKRITVAMVVFFQ